MALPEQPGNLVFGPRRFMQSLAPADGILGVPDVLCPAVAITMDVTVVRVLGILATRTETVINPTVVLEIP